MLTATTLPQLGKMLNDLAEEASVVGLQLHFGKTKIISNMQARRGASEAKHVTVLGQDVEVLPFADSVTYLGREVSFKDHQDLELQNRIAKAWGKFMAHKHELCGPHYPLRDRLRLFGATITSSVLYGCGTWAMTAERERKLRTTQRKMLRRMVGSKRRKTATTDRADAEDTGMQIDKDGTAGSTSSVASSMSTSSSSDEEEGDEEQAEDRESWTEWIRRATTLAADAARKAGVVDWVEEERRRKWRWAGHVARREDGRRSRRLLDWEPLGGRRSWGRPVIRWEDTLCQFAKTKGETWTTAAKDKNKWGSWEDDFVAVRW